MKPALALVRTARLSLRSKLGIVSGIPIPEPSRSKIRMQLEACEVGDSFLTTNTCVHLHASRLGIKIKTSNKGCTDKYIRVWKIKDAPCA